MLSDQIITLIKETYNISPKYCDNFIKASQFYDELFEIEETKKYLKEIVRNNPSSITFNFCLK